MKCPECRCEIAINAAFVLFCGCGEKYEKNVAPTQTLPQRWAPVAKEVQAFREFYISGGKKS